ncbi:nucleotidyltransferase family protein [Methylacidimicrobium tartarophylax]|uniref:Molybdenum cofactor cytidylyltransferase n=1 Tax=Methylacidimicrobium tartarophylax TaxID=1041768 RepID=A0A5E6MEZ9_9BACT|nr:nucleotidyltransferase family protein [Methylacidimicrobium tartarophylax]VVM07815.1 molybdenum cofactor cytidylyltransferase [Methylacidimicrobium tartarophylax]
MAAIVLAAGGSVRMRPAHKLLLPIGGEALIRRAVRSAREAELFPIIVVVGYRGNEAAAAVADLGVICLPNPEWETGIASSIRAGIAALPDDCPGTVILLADMPRVDASHLRRLSNAFASNEEAGILIPTYRGRRGNPLIWSRRHFAALAALSGDRGGSALLVQLGPFVREVPMEDDGVLVDLDTPDEFRREVLRALSRGKGSDPKGRCPERELLLSPSNGKR